MPKWERKSVCGRSWRRICHVKESLSTTSTNMLQFVFKLSWNSKIHYHKTSPVWEINSGSVCFVVFNDFCVISIPQWKVNTSANRCSKSYSYCHKFEARWSSHLCWICVFDRRKTTTQKRSGISNKWGEVVIELKAESMSCRSDEFPLLLFW
jgi:hypothetical protein